MINTVILDTYPLGLVTQRKGVVLADGCRSWITNLLVANVRVMVPEIADYELRRELVRAGQTASIARLDAFNAAFPDRYLPITTETMRLAANL